MTVVLQTVKIKHSLYTNPSFVDIMRGKTYTGTGKTNPHARLRSGVDSSQNHRELNRKPTPNALYWDLT